MNFRDPTRESLPEDYRESIDPQTSVRDRGIPRVPLPRFDAKPIPPILKMGPPFSERFDRDIDAIDSPPGPGGGGSTQWPLQLVKVDASNVKVLLGTVNGGTPTGINTNIDVSGTDGTWVIYMHVSISGTTASGPEVLSATSGPVPSDSSTDSYRLIGEVDVSSGAITAVRPSMAWSQNVTVCTADIPPFAWTTGA